MTKTWNVGEWCAGGTIIATITGRILQIKICDYKTTNVIPQGIGTIETTDRELISKADNFLNKFTTSYYAGQVTDWLLKKIDFNKTKTF